MPDTESTQRSAESDAPRSGSALVERYRADTAFLVGARFGREQERERIAQRVALSAPIECRWCPPGCPSCEPDDCECYRHQGWTDKTVDPDWPYSVISPTSTTTEAQR